MHTLDHNAFMKRAIKAGMANPDAPFGAVLVDRTDGQVVATGCNDSKIDPTQHGEIDCIRNAAGIIDWERRNDYALYTTAEPCPMCMGACIWARYGTVVYGTSSVYLTRTGWPQIDLRAEELAAKAGWSPDRVIGGVLENECNAMFDAAIKRWNKP